MDHPIVGALLYSHCWYSLAPYEWWRFCPKWSPARGIVLPSAGRWYSYKQKGKSAIPIMTHQTQINMAASRNPIHKWHKSSLEIIHFLYVYVYVYVYISLSLTNYQLVIFRAHCGTFGVAPSGTTCGVRDTSWADQLPSMSMGPRVPWAEAWRFIPWRRSSL